MARWTAVSRDVLAEQVLLQIEGFADGVERELRKVVGVVYALPRHQRVIARFVAIAVVVHLHAGLPGRADQKWSRLDGSAHGEASCFIVCIFGHRVGRPAGQCPDRSCCAPMARNRQRVKAKGTLVTVGGLVGEQDHPHRNVPDGRFHPM